MTLLVGGSNTVHKTIFNQKIQKMSAKDILFYLKNEGGFQYFCNTDNWNVARCKKWVRENFPCSAKIANEVANEIVSWT